MVKRIITGQIKLMSTQFMKKAGVRTRRRNSLLTRERNCPLRRPVPAISAALRARWAAKLSEPPTAPRK